MRTIIIIATIILGASFHINAQEAVSQILFEETDFNFDTILQNSNGEHVFRFSNVGNAPLAIISAFSSCGCVVPEWPKEPIAPGLTSKIKVKYNTSKTGRFTKVIVVKSNAKDSPKTLLRIKGVVVETKEKGNPKDKQIIKNN